MGGGGGEGRCYTSVTNRPKHTQTAFISLISTEKKLRQLYRLIDSSFKHINCEGSMILLLLFLAMYTINGIHTLSV